MATYAPRVRCPKRGRRELLELVLVAGVDLQGGWRLQWERPLVEPDGQTNETNSQTQMANQQHARLKPSTQILGRSPKNMNSDTRLKLTIKKIL